MHGLSKHRDSISILNKRCCQGKGCFLFHFFATKGTWALGLFGSGGNKHILGRMDSTSRFAVEIRVGESHSAISQDWGFFLKV